MPTSYPAKQGAWDAGDSTAQKSDQALLVRIRERFDYMVSAWKEIRDAGELDMRALSIEGPWEPEERADRATNKRPCIHLDQLTQYVNGLVNEVRSNPIAIKISPAGQGATDKTAELRGNRIREIEYQSNATQAYQCAFECAVTRSYGVFGATIEYKNWKSFERVIKIRRLANPDAVLWDTDCKEADSSDMQDAFVLDRVPKKDFERRYPDATITSFNADDIRVAPAWFDDDSVQVAEYWYLEKKRRRMFRVQSPQGERILFADEHQGFQAKGEHLILADGTIYPILDERKTEEPSIKQCFTNGIEILDRSDLPGKWIPIFPVIGKEKYVRDGGKVKREIDSYIRMARDGQMLWDYYKTNEAETVGMVPKTPWVGYKGQFENNDDEWSTVNRVPRAFLEAKATTEEVPNTVLPLPQRQTFEPPIQALEIGSEAARRSIQAAVGSYGFTRLDDTNVKSGVALKNIERQNDDGSFHFVDNFKVSLRHAGRVVNGWLDDVETEARDVGIRKLNGEHEVVRINDPKNTNEQGEQEFNRYALSEDAEHEVAISTGPSYQSQREEASAFADTLAQIPELMPRIADLVVKLKNLGPIGDEIAERLKPPDLADKESPQALASELQKWTDLAETLGQKVEMLEAAQAAKKLELESKEKIAALQADVDKLRIQADIAKCDADGEKSRQLMQADAAKTMATLESKEAIEGLKLEFQKLQAHIERVAAVEQQPEVISQEPQPEAPA